MSRTRPLHDYERLDEDDAMQGVRWTVEPEHAGHTMEVLGRIVDKSGAQRSSMFVVRCSCGDEYRMARVTIDKALRRRARGS